MFLRFSPSAPPECVSAGAAFDDARVSPVVRQTLQHWAYELTKPDHDAYAAKVRSGKSTSFVGVVAAPAKKRGGAGDGGDDGGGGGGGAGGGKRARRA